MWWLALLGIGIAVVGLVLLYRSAKADHEAAELYKAPATGFGDSDE